MKKAYIILFGLFILVIIIIVVYFYNYNMQFKEIQQFNLEYESYYENEVYGTEVATAINKAIDNNEKYKVEKDENGYYIENNNSVNIDIKIIDNNTTYKMEILYNGGISEFVQNYGEIKFKCTQIEYNSENKVKYLLFEQITQ